MRPAILRVHFPRGALPVRGYLCPSCGEDAILAADATLVQELGRSLGLSGVDNRRRRKLQKHGNSTTVSLDPEFLRKHGIKAGDSVIVAERGDELVIQVE